MLWIFNFSIVYQCQLPIFIKPILNNFFFKYKNTYFLFPFIFCINIEIYDSFIRSYRITILLLAEIRSLYISHVTRYVSRDTLFLSAQYLEKLLWFSREESHASEKFAPRWRKRIWAFGIPLSRVLMRISGITDMKHGCATPDSGRSASTTRRAAGRDTRI